jgi:hypothetical protein
MALHLSARPNCLAEYREIGKVEWLFIEPLLEFRRCKTLGGGRYGTRHAFAKYKAAMLPGELERTASSALEAAARNFAGASAVAECKDSERREEESPSPPRPGLVNDDAFFNAGFDAITTPMADKSLGINYWLEPNKEQEKKPARGELPEGYVRVNGIVGRMIEVGASGLLMAASGTVRPVRKDDAWRIGFVDAKNGGDRWAGKFDGETEALLAVGDVRYAGRVKAEELRVKVGPDRKGGWRG